jgi:hypothetical protein
MTWAVVQRGLEPGEDHAFYLSGGKSYDPKWSDDEAAAQEFPTYCKAAAVRGTIIAMRGGVGGSTLSAPEVVRHPKGDYNDDQAQDRC